MSSSERKIKQVAKFLSYVLGRHPDEFGLIPDENGFVPIKSLLQALHEEDGYRHLKMGHLREIELTLLPCPIEMNGPLIRAADRQALPTLSVPTLLPKLLYTAVRSRAYPAVHARGVKARNDAPIVLSSDKGMARRLGSRKDNHPMLLTIQTKELAASGAVLRQFGEQLYTSDVIPLGCFTGPPLPKEQPSKQKDKKQAEPKMPKAPGSFFPDMTSDIADGASKKRRHKEDAKKSWQKERRLARKQKNRFEP